MARYVVSSIGPTPSTTAATAGIVKVDLTGTLCSPKIYEWSIGPHANSADETYLVRAKRQTAAGTWTNAVTPDPVDKHSGASLATAANTSTAAGAADVELGRWGYHLRGGYRWVAVPGGELSVLLAANAGIIWEYVFAQGTSLQDPSVWFDE